MTMMMMTVNEFDIKLENLKNVIVKFFFNYRKCKTIKSSC